MKKNYGFANAIAAIGLAFSTSTYAVEYKVIDLGLNNSPFQINNLGQVIGSESSHCCSSYYFWSAATGRINFANPIKALNNNGVVMAYAYGDYVQWSPLAGLTSKLANGSISTITSFNDVGGYAGSLSNGSINEAAAWIAGPPVSGVSPVVVSPAVKTYISPGNQAVAINNSGAFVSNVFVAGHADWRDDKVHPFIWTAVDGAIDLGPLGSVDGDTTATAMNEAGTVIGYGNHRGRSRTRSFIWTQGGGMQDLGSPYVASDAPWIDFDQQILAADVNSSGSIVGYSRKNSAGDADAFLWSPANGNVIIDSLLAESAKLDGWHISSARSINDEGWIVGSGVVGGEVHGIMLVPVPEPATWMLMLLAGTFVLPVMRKRSRSEALPA